MQVLTWFARAVVAACMLGATTASAGLFPTYPTGSGAGVWEVDRYAPAGFTNAGTVNGRASVLALALSASDSQANRPPAYSGAFYNTQGRGFQVDLPAYSVLYGSVYLPSPWATTNAGNAVQNRRSEMWGVLSPATGGDTCAGSGCNLFPIIGFTNASASDPLNQGGAGRYRVFDSNIGFVDLGTPVGYDQWTDVCTVFTGSELRFYINGAQVYVQSSLVQSDPSYGPPTKFTRETMQAYNFGTAYTAQWSSLGAGTLTTTAVAAGNPQSTPVSNAFATALQVLATDATGAPLPCVPVTFTAPGAGASAVLSATTVITNLQGIAQVTATANATAGTYAVAAAAPGVTAVAFNLTNVGIPGAIVATGGAGQTTPVGTAFGAPLAAKVTDGGGNPVAGALVTFALPGSGPAATFPGSVTTATATTSAAGIATSPQVTANALPGGYAGTASVTGVATPASFALANTINPVTLAKSMLPAAIIPGGTSVLTLTLGNANAVPLTLTAPFNDFMPLGVGATSVNTGTCAGVTVTTLSLTMAAGSTIPVNGCTIVLTVSASAPGTYINTTEALATSGGVAPPASATLTVIASGASLGKTMQPGTINAGGNSTLTLTLGNAGATGIALVAPFTDGMPAGLTTVGGNTGTCAGVTVGATHITMAAGAVIPAGGCTIVVAVTSVTPGTVTNTTGALQTSAGTIAPASAQLTVAAAAPTLAKAFVPTAIVPSGSAALTLTLANAHPVALTLTAPFTDSMPTGVTLAGGNTGTCANVSTTATLITMPAGSSIPAGGCTIVVTVTSATPGVAVNTTSVLATSGGSTPAASASLTVAAINLSASGGGGQSTVIGTSFPAALQATVTGGGMPVAGVAVTFTLPPAVLASAVAAAAGVPSGTFPGGASSVTVTSNALGVATSPVITANGIVGTYAASAAVAGVAAPVSYTLANIAASPAVVEPIPALGLPGMLLLMLAVLAMGVRTMGASRRR